MRNRGDRVDNLSLLYHNFNIRATTCDLCRGVPTNLKVGDSVLQAVPHPDWTVGIWDGLFALHPWQALLVSLAIAPVGLLAWRWLTQGIVVNPLTHDWWASNFNVCLAFGVAAMFWLAQRMPAGSGHHDGWVYALLNYGSLAFWLSFAMFKWWDERKDVTTWERRLGATTVYHIGVLMYLGGLYTILFVNTLGAPWFMSPMHFAMHLVAILAVAAWLFAGVVLDVQFRTAPDGKSKFEYTSPVDGWYNLRRFGEWFTFSINLDLEAKALRPWNFIINRAPIQGFLALVMVSPGAFFLLNWAIRGEWIPFSYQWYSALIGDVLLALLGFSYLRVIHYGYWQGEVFKRRFWHYFWIVVFYGVGILHMWQERGSVTTWERRLGANSVYHTFVVYPLLGYALVVLFWLAFKYARSWHWRAVTILVTVALVGGWYALGIYDGAHQFAPNGVSKHVYSSPEDGWRNIRIAYEWFVGLF